MEKIYLCLYLSALCLFPAHAQRPVESPESDLAERIGRAIPLSSEQEDRLASLYGTMLLKIDDATDSLGPLAEKRLGTRLKTKYAKDLVAIDEAPENVRDARSRALVRKVSIELRADLEKEMLGKLRVIVLDFFAGASKLLKTSQRPKLKSLKTRYLAEWDRAKTPEIRKELDLILGANPTKRL